MNKFTKLQNLHSKTSLWKKFWTLQFRCLSIEGVYPPITTPFNENQEIDYEELEKNVERWNKVPFAGFAVHGSNGEYVYQTESEKINVLKKVKKFADNDKLLMVGTGCESTAATINLTNEMAKHGADVALIATPSYYKSKMDAMALTKHYTQVADQSSMPVVLYNVPANTTVDIPVEVCVKLADHPNIIGMKESGGDITKIGEICHRTNASNGGFEVLAGSAGFLLPSLMLGAKGGVCALANMMGDEVCRLYQLYRNGDYDSAVDLQKRLIAPNNAVTKIFGPPGVKHAMEWFGYYGGQPRSPLQPLDDAAVSKLKQIFVENGFLK